jgi:hypothetical protein
VSTDAPKGTVGPYSESEAVVDALAGRGPCRHGVWPHQETVVRCPDCPPPFDFSGLFSRDVQ